MKPVSEEEHRKSMELLRLGRPDYVMQHLRVFEHLLFGEDGPYKKNGVDYVKAREVFSFIQKLVHDAYYAPILGRSHAMVRPRVIAQYEQYLRYMKENLPIGTGLLNEERTQDCS